MGGNATGTGREVRRMTGVSRPGERACGPVQRHRFTLVPSLFLPCSPLVPSFFHSIALELVRSRVRMRFVAMKCGPTRLAAAPALGEPYIGGSTHVQSIPYSAHREVQAGNLAGRCGTRQSRVPLAS